MTVWLNGSLVEAALVDCADRGFTLGDGLFETICFASGRPRHWDRHWARFTKGAEQLGIPIPTSQSEVLQAFADLARSNGLNDGTVRVTLTRGIGARGLLPPATPSPTLVITMVAAAAPLGPARLTICTVTRRNQFSPLSQIKSLNYLDGILARQEASQKGFDEALLLNTEGYVAETTVSSVFAWLDGELVTPPIKDGALPGVARGLVIERLGARERSLSLADLLRSEEIVLTNALGCRSGIEIDGKLFAVGQKIQEIQSTLLRP
jgi:branched-chain amino acid aminotransferase